MKTTERKDILNDRELGIVPIIHYIIIMFWILLYKLRVVIESSVIINVLSMSTLICVIYILYLFTYWNITKDKLRKLINIIILILLNQVTLIDYNTNKISLILLIILFIINLHRNMKEKNNIKYTSISIINFFMILAILLQIELITINLGVFIIIIEFFDILTNDQNRFLNLLPLSLNMHKYFVMVVIIFFTLIALIFSLDEVVINLTIHTILFMFEVIVFFNYISPEYEKSMYKDQQYAEIKSILTYMNKNSNEFSEYLHNDVLQDIISSRNLLDLNKPYVEEAKSILNELQKNIRINMSFYDTRIFEDFTLNENIESIIDAIKNRYPDKSFQIKKEIQDNLNSNYSKSDEEKLILDILKELLNNAYKHSKKETQNKIIIKVEKEKRNLILTISNNADNNAYKQALKGGNTISIIRSQLKLFDGNIALIYDEGVITLRCNIYTGEG